MICKVNICVLEKYAQICINYTCTKQEKKGNSKIFPFTSLFILKMQFVKKPLFLTKLGIQDLDVVLRTGRMRWFGHVERSTGWISEVRKLNVVAQKRSGRPRKSWDEVIKNDRKKLDMNSADPQNRS